MSLLEVKNLVVEFPGRRGTLRALDDISFSIAPGEILGVVGESGAGKSLTGAAIIGTAPSGGIAVGTNGAVLGALTFTNLKVVHPVRVRMLRPVTLTALTAWMAASGMLIARPDWNTDAMRALWWITSAYLIGLCLWRSAMLATPTAKREAPPSKPKPENGLEWLLDLVTGAVGRATN